MQQLCYDVPIAIAGSTEDEDEHGLLLALSADESVTLYEILLAEKLDLEAKVKRTNRRRRWLKGA